MPPHSLPSAQVAALALLADCLRRGADGLADDAFEKAIGEGVDIEILIAMTNAADDDARAAIMSSAKGAR